MGWLKKVILSILSVLFITLISCESIRSKSEIHHEESFSQEDLIAHFFMQIQHWNTLSVPTLDSLGYQISGMDTSLTFLPYSNTYENKSFLFATKNKNALSVFEESTFLSESMPIQQSFYKVWRKSVNNLQVLDLSIEPHPTLEWVFVVRRRGQE